MLISWGFCQYIILERSLVGKAWIQFLISMADGRDSLSSDLVAAISFYANSRWW